MYLKSQFGVGYYLTLVKQTSREQHQQDDFGPFHNVAEANVEDKSNSCSLNSVDEAEDEGISDISTHETIINPSNLNEK